MQDKWTKEKPKKYFEWENRMLISARWGNWVEDRIEALKKDRDKWKWDWLRDAKRLREENGKNILEIRHLGKALNDWQSANLDLDKKNTALEMRLLSKNEHERIIGDLLEENNIMDYNFIWISDKLPCDIRYLEGRIYSDILNNSYKKLLSICYL